MSVVDLRVELWAYDKTERVWKQVGDIDPNHPESPLIASSVEPRYNAAGPWSTTTPLNGLEWVTRDHLVTFDFRDTRETCRISRLRRAPDESGLPMLDLSGTTAFSVFMGVLGFPNPSEAATDQTSVRYYTEGPAETVLRDIIAANFARLGYDVTVAASQGRGSTVTVSSEFADLLEIVKEKATLGGIRVNVGLVNREGSHTRADLHVWFDEPTDRSADFEFSTDAQTLIAWSEEWTEPTATRAIIQRARDRQSREVQSVSASTNRITVKPKESGLRTGDIISLSVDAGGALPAPLEVGEEYHAVRVDKDTFAVALTRADASAGLVVDLTTEGSGKMSVTESFRRYRQVVDTSAESSAFGWVREVLVVGNSEDKATALDEQGRTAIDEGKAQSAIELETTETPGMRYGDPIRVGDWVPVILPVFDSLVDEEERRAVEQVGAARVSASTAEGLVVQLIPGDPDATDPETQQAADIRRVKAKLRKARED